MYLRDGTDLRGPLNAEGKAIVGRVLCESHTVFQGQMGICGFKMASGFTVLEI